MTKYGKTQHGDAWLTPGAIICFNCPLHPSTCDESKITAGDLRFVKQPPDCLRDYVLWKRVSLKVGDTLALQTLGRGMTANAFLRAVDLTAERERIYLELKPKMEALCHLKRSSSF